VIMSSSILAGIAPLVNSFSACRILNAFRGDCRRRSARGHQAVYREPKERLMRQKTPSD
jgi:hypothetical protein